MTDQYLLMKALHILGVVLFLGNIIITGWWKTAADMTRDPLVVAFAQRQVTLTDWVFTAGGAALVFVTGMVNAAQMGVVVRNGFQVDLSTLSLTWLRQGFWMFTLSGILWVLVLIPVQIKQARMARQFRRDQPIPPLYWTLGRIWLWVGIVAIILPMINLYWMVYKPA